MPVTVMEKLTALCLQSDISHLLTALAAHASVEILPACVLDDDTGLLPMLTAGSAEAAEAAARIDKLLPVFIARAPHHSRRMRTKIPVDTQEFLRSGAYERALKTANEAERLLAHIAELTERKTAEQDEMGALLPYLSHAFALDDPGTKATAFLLGRLPAEVTPATLDEAATATGFVFEILSADKNGVYVAVIAHRAMQDEVSATLTALGFTSAKWRNSTGRASVLFDAASARAKALDDDIIRANAQLDSLADNLTDIKILSDILHTEARLAAYREKMQALGSCAILSAWCPTHERERVAALLDTLDVAYRFEQAAEEEKAPVLADTPPVQGKLGPILNTYTYPSVFGLRTALPLQLLLFLFFGLLFADVGYGILTALVFFPVARFLAIEVRSKNAFYTLAYHGLGAIPFGVLTGNYFGDWLTHLPGKPTLVPFPALAAHVNALRALLCRPRTFLALALSVSALVLLLDFADRLIHLCRAGKPIDAALTLLPELLVLSGIGLLPFFPLIGLGVAAIGLAAVVLITTYKTKGFKNRMTLCGGALLALLIRLFELLGAARVALVGFALLPVTRLIALLPLERGEALVWYLGLLLVFLISHLLGVALNRATALARRARLTYIAHHAVHYPAREALFQPMRLPQRYTAALPAYDTDTAGDTQTPPDANDAPVAYTTQKL